MSINSYPQNVYGAVQGPQGFQGNQGIPVIGPQGNQGNR